MDEKTPPPSYGSQEVVDKVAMFSKPRLPPPVDVFTGKKTCHIFNIPAHYLTPSPLQKDAAQLNVQMGFVPCIGAKCALWNAERLECLDVTKKKADIRVPELLEQIDGFMRLHRDESGG